MFFKRFFLPITGSFLTGFGSAYLILKKDTNLNDILANFNTSPLYASTAINSNVKDLVPYNNSTEIIKPGSVDDLATCRGNKTSEIMRHGYPSLDNLRVFDDYGINIYFHYQF